MQTNSDFTPERSGNSPDNRTLYAEAIDLYNAKRYDDAKKKVRFFRECDAIITN